MLHSSPWRLGKLILSDQHIWANSILLISKELNIKSGFSVSRKLIVPLFLILSKHLTETSHGGRGTSFMSWLLTVVIPWPAAPWFHSLSVLTDFPHLTTLHSGYHSWAHFMDENPRTGAQLVCQHPRIWVHRVGLQTLIKLCFPLNSERLLCWRASLMTCYLQARHTRHR